MTKSSTHIVKLRRVRPQTWSAFTNLNCGGTIERANRSKVQPLGFNTFDSRGLPYAVVKFLL